MKDRTILKAEVDITKGRNDAFEAAAKQLGRFINALDLGPSAHNELLDLICKQVSVAERDAFKFGFNMASKLVHDYYSDEND